MAINLLGITPHKVSRDLSGYITLLYGPAKIGKTTFGSQMPKHLIIAAERGYNALPGVMVQDITTWGEFKQTVRELKKPEVKEAFKSLIIDTVDILADMCQKYICQQLGVENIGDGGWTNNGWAKYKKEFEETFRTLAQLGYAIVFISHDKEKTVQPQNGAAYQQICSSLQSSALTIVENMCDIIGYAHNKIMPDGSQRRVLTLRSPDDSIRVGCRFKYMKPEIDFSYNALVEALNNAIEESGQESGGTFITDEAVTRNIAPTYDYDEQRKKFQSLVGQLMKSPEDNAMGAKITQVIEKYLGKGKKIVDTTPDQAELVYLICSEMEDDLLNK